MSYASDPNPFAVTSSQWPGAVAAPAGPRRVGGLATALTVLLPIAAVFAALTAAAFFFRAAMLNDMAAGVSPGRDAAARADGSVILMAALLVLACLATAVVFIIWQYRFVANSRLLGSTSRLGPGWAVAGWFIPFANHVLPAVQLFSASRASDRAGIASTRGRGKGSKVVIAWIVTFMVGADLATAHQVEDGSITVRRFADLDTVAGTGGLILVVAAVLAIVMVRTLTHRQESALATVAGPVAYPSAPPVTYHASAPPASYQTSVAQPAWTEPLPVRPAPRGRHVKSSGRPANPPSATPISTPPAPPPVPPIPPPV
jgi:hypothetical protein